jgi:hypothetical protein
MILSLKRSIIVALHQVNQNSNKKTQKHMNDKPQDDKI